MPINIIAGSVAPTHEQVNKILDKCEEVFRAQLDTVSRDRAWADTLRHPVVNEYLDGCVLQRQPLPARILENGIV